LIGSVFQDTQDNTRLRQCSGIVGGYYIGVFSNALKRSQPINNRKKLEIVSTYRNFELVQSI